MTNFQRRPRLFLSCAAILLSITTGFAANDGDYVATSTDTKATTTTSSSDDLGTGNFSKFPFRVSVSVRGGYDDNVATSHFDRQASWFTNGSIALTYDFGDPRTQLSLQVGGGATYYWDHPHDVNGSAIGFNGGQDYDVNAYVNATLLHKFSDRLSFNASVYLTYQTEPDFTLALGIDRRSGNFFYTLDRFTLNYQWAPRFATATSYTLGAIRYDDSNVSFFEDRIENTFGNEFKFLLWPTTALVAEYRFEMINYDHDLGRDSRTHFVLGGFDHTFNPRFNISFRGGAEFRDYYQMDSTSTAPYFEGTLNYSIAKQTTVSWTNRYGLEEPDVLLNPRRETFRTGLQVMHNITPRITFSGGAYYEHDEYDSVTSTTVVSPAFSEDAFDLALNLRYAFNRWFGIEAGYNHTEVWSDIPLREYYRNRYWAGLNVLF